MPKAIFRAATCLLVASLILGSTGTQVAAYALAAPHAPHLNPFEHQALAGMALAFEHKRLLHEAPFEESELVSYQRGLGKGAIAVTFLSLILAVSSPIHRTLLAPSSTFSAPQVNSSPYNEQGISVLNNLNDLVAVLKTPLPEKIDYKLYQLQTGSLRVYYIQFRSQQLFFDYTARGVYWNEIKEGKLTRKDAAMTTADLERAIKKDESNIENWIGTTYDFQEDIVKPYNAYLALNARYPVSFSNQELQFLSDLQRWGFITKSGSSYLVGPTRQSLFTVAPGNDPSTLGHELVHIFYDLDPAIQKIFTRTVWDSLSRKEKAAFKRVLAKMQLGYDVQNPDVVKGELAAYAYEGFAGHGFNKDPALSQKRLDEIERSSREIFSRYPFLRKTPPPVNQTTSPAQHASRRLSSAA